MSTEDRRVYEMSTTAADAGLDVAEWAYRARLAAGLSPAELAKTVKSAMEAIERLEDGDPTLPLNLIAHVAHVTNMPLQLTVSARDSDIDKPGPEEPHSQGG